MRKEVDFHINSGSNAESCFLSVLVSEIYQFQNKLRKYCSHNIFTNKRPITPTKA